MKGFRRWCCEAEQATLEAAAVVPPAVGSQLVQQGSLSSLRCRVPFACAVCLYLGCVGTGCQAAPLEEAGPSVPSLAAYRTHEAVVLGRALRCLRCFERPAGDYRAWKRGRCSGELPPQGMPASMPCELVRAGIRGC